MNGPEHRRYPRVPVTRPVRIRTSSGAVVRARLVNISQDGAELDAYDCDLSAWPGVEESYFYGYMDGDEIVIEGGWMLYPECWSDFISDGQATATASTISGSITVDGDCGSGTQTFSLVPSSRKSLPVPPRARRDRNAPPLRP